MKVLGGETNLNAPISVGSARVVRVFNSDSSNLLVTRKTSGGTTVGTFMVPAGEVVYCEKDYTDTLEGSANLQAARVAFSPMMSFVGQDAVVPTYTHSVSATAVDEGGNFTTTITTTNVDDGTNLYWELTGVQAEDFSSGALTGTVSVSSNSATFSHTVDEDLTTEGTETATIKVYSDSGRNTQVGNSLTVTISDTSTTPTGDFSAQFDGSNDRMTLAATSDFAFGTGDFTMEAFVFRTSDPKPYSRLWHFGPFFSSNDTVGVCFDDADHPNKVTFTSYKNRNVGGVNAAGRVLISSTSVENNSWYHIAITRASGTFRLYVNGVVEDSEAQFTDSLEDSGTNTLAIGGTVDRMIEEPFAGRVSNLRIIKGQALYTTNNFSVPTEALTTTSQSATSSNVKLLCCKTSTLTAADVKPGTITVEGAVSSTEDPFAGDWSLELNGSEGFRTGTSNDFKPGLDSFTMEVWVKFDSVSGLGVIVDSRSGSIQNTPILSRDASGYIYAANTGSSNHRGGAMYHILKSTTQVTTGNWYHIAWSRSGSSNKLFINGILEDTYTDGDNYNGGPGYFEIGGAVHQSNYFTNGLLSNFRFTKGQALYTSSFNPSASALTLTSQGATESNVKFLGFTKSMLQQSVFNASGSFNSFIGSPSMKSDDPFEGDHSVEFDGNDYLTIADSTDFDLDSSDFTIECWYNPDTNPSWCGLLAQWPNGNYNVTNSWTFEPVGSTLSFYYCNTNGAFHNADASGALQTNQWQHCAVTRSGNTINVWLNGSKGPDHTIVGTMQNSTVNVDIGGNVAGSGYVDGKISNIRLTKGQALYTSNFTPSTSALTTTSQGATESNVKLLCCNKSVVNMATVTPNPITIGGGDPTPSTSDPY